MLILLLLYTVLGQTSSPLPIYSRVYLQGMKRYENERIKTELINQAITYLETEVFTAAKKGLVKYTTDPVEECENNEFRLDKEVCENIVNEIKTLVSERFPDSDLIYDTNTKQYTLKWD